MDFGFSEEEKTLRNEISEFVRKELPSDFRVWLFDIEDQFDSKAWPIAQVITRKLGKRNWLAPHWPEEYGGQGAAYTRYIVCHEELVYHGVPGYDMGIGGISWIGPSLMFFGNEELKKTHLPQLARGEQFWNTAYSEPGSGSDLGSLQCRATTQGTDYVINGQKVWISCSHTADWCWLAVRTRTDGPKHRGISIIVVDMKSKGITVRPALSMAYVPALGEIFFDDVHVPKENLVGEENKGWEYLVKALEYERACAGLLFAAGARRAFEDIVLLTRDIKYQKQSPVNYPSIRSKLANAAIEVELARILAYRAAWLLSMQQPSNHETAMSKLFSTEVTQRVANMSMQILGLYGQLDGQSKYTRLQGLVKHGYLTSVGNTMLAGTSEIERNVIATVGLGLPR